MKKRHRIPAGFFLFVSIATLAAGAEHLPVPALNEAAQLAAEAETNGRTTILGREGWMYFAPELRHLGAGKFWGESAAEVSRAARADQADPLPAILDFKEQLDRAGIELLLVPVPPKAVIYPEHVFSAGDAGEGARIDAFHQEFYANLREHGIEVVDLVPEFLERKSDLQLYCRQDTHWSGEACVLVAGIIHKIIEDRPWLREVQRQTFVSEDETQAIAGDLVREADGTGVEPETVRLRVVGNSGASGVEPVAPDPESPVILLGDSHNLVFHSGGDMHAFGAGLADQLALVLGFPVDLVAVRGSGATPARINLLRRARQPEYLQKKKLLIWCFSAREFTESNGWAKVPVIK